MTESKKEVGSTVGGVGVGDGEMTESKKEVGSEVSGVGVGVGEAS